MTLDLEHRFAFCVALAEEAGRLALSRQQDELIVNAKGPQDWVTEVDRDVEALIRSRLAETFPSDAFVGEESGGEPGEAVWVVDPIDGTTNFLRGLPEFAVSIAFVAGDVTELGVICAPAFGKTYTARRGHGAWCGAQRLQVRDTSTITEAVVTVGYGAQQDREAFIRCLSSLLEAGAAFRRFGSATIGLSAVAAGHVDAFWQQHLAPWDVLAGLLLVREAGGVTNDFLENNGMRNGNPTLATVPAIGHTLSELTGVDLAP